MYINGATADVWAKKIKSASKSMIIKIGVSQTRLRTLKNSQNSLTIESLDINPSSNIAGYNVPYPIEPDPSYASMTWPGDLKIDPEDLS